MMKNKASGYESALVESLLNEIPEEEFDKIEKRMKLAVRIADGIKAKGWKQIDLLRALKKDNPSEISKWLSGTHNFTIDTLIDIERVLGITLLNLQDKPVEHVVTYRLEVVEKVEVSNERKGFLGVAGQTVPGYSFESFNLNVLANNLQHS